MRNAHFIARVWQNKQIGREFERVLSERLFILRKLVAIGSSFAINEIGI